MKILQLLALVAGTQAIRINSMYHDDYDNQLPSKKDLDDAVANGTLPNVTGAGNSSTVVNSVNCTAFLNATTEELETNFTELLKNFTDARAPVALKAGNQTLNATSNPNFVNASLLSSTNIDNLTAHMKNMTDFLEKYKKRLVTDGDIKDKSLSLDDLSNKNVTAVKNYVRYVQKVLLETPLIKYISSNFTDAKLADAATVVQTNVTLNVNASSNASMNASINATTTIRSVVPNDVTEALNKLDKAADKMVALDGSTYHNIYLAWDKQYVCNGTIAARAAAMNATKNHTYPNRTNFSNETCSANRTREINITNATAAAAAAAADVVAAHQKTTSAQVKK